MVGLGLEADLDCIEGVFDIFTYHASKLVGLVYVLPTPKGLTHRAKENIFPSVH
jgi:hypothetical protein